MLKFLIFDLDETLYPRNAGLMQEIGVRIIRYLIENLGLPADQAQDCGNGITFNTARRCAASSSNGPTSIPRTICTTCTTSTLADYIGPNPALGDMLRSLPQSKVIFTNANVEHAQNVLNDSGLRRSV